MKNVDVGQTINTLANLGVIAGIVFLGIEVSQNQASLEEANTINRATVTSAAVESINEWRALLLQDDELMQAWSAGVSGVDLTDDDANRFNLLCQNAVWNLVMLHERAEMLGLPTRARGAAAAWGDSLQSPRILDCWERQKPIVQRWGYESFITAVEPFEP